MSNTIEICDITGEHRLGWALYDQHEVDRAGGYAGPDEPVVLVDWYFFRCPRCGAENPDLEILVDNPAAPVFVCEHCGEEIQCGGDEPSIQVYFN
jgi:hypothetical protein